MAYLFLLWPLAYTKNFNDTNADAPFAKNIRRETEMPKKKQQGRRKIDRYVLYTQ